MAVKTSFYFKISHLAGMAHNDDGLNVGCFTQINLHLKKSPTPEEYERLIVIAKKLISNQISIDVDHISNTSREEYEANED